MSEPSWRLGGSLPLRELARHPSAVAERVSCGPALVLARRGRPSLVVMSATAYAALVAQVETGD